MINAEEKRGNQTVIAKLSSAKQIPKGVKREVYGGYLFLQALYHQLELHKACKRIEKRHQFEFDLSAILSMLVYTRLLKPSSKRTAVETSNKFLEPPGCRLHQVYRALGVLAAHSDEIQAALYASSKNVIRRNKHILYYDCTNFYFEIEKEDDFRKYGK